MTVLITLTTAGPDTGPFNLYSDIDGFTVPFETGVSKAALLGGYSSTLVPDGTITIRVVSVGACVNNVDISVVYPTTTTTTTAGPTTTTTTTAAPSYYAFLVSWPGRASSSAACAETSFPHILYSNLYPMDAGHIMYTDSGLTNPLVGGDLWYQDGINGVSFQIDNTGVITSFFNCP